MKRMRESYLEGIAIHFDPEHVQNHPARELGDLLFGRGKKWQSRSAMAIH